MTGTRGITLVDVLGPRGLLKAHVAGWESRPAQLEMAGAVADALAERRPLLVEAGTGTGKTLSYLVPALLSGLKVVVSTGTKNLQEQILKKDIPLLRDSLPFDFHAVALKGISNYLCRRRYNAWSAQQAMFGETHPVIERLRTWAEETETGDRAELVGLPDDAPQWLDVSATSETRIGPRCPYFEDCFVTRARREAQTADLVVVNHHLFFADLALRAAWPQAQLLPPYEAVIFDEAHQVEDVATDYFSITVSTLRLLSLLRDVRKAVGQGYLDGRVERSAHRVESVGNSMFAALRERLPQSARVLVDDRIWRGAPTQDFHDLDNALAEVGGAAAASPSGDTPMAREAAENVGRRAQALRDDLAFVAERAARDRVYWAETRGRTVLLHASPVDVSEILRDRLIQPLESVIFTSATLAAGGTFDYARSRLGTGAAAELRLDSPFDYARQALLYLPRDLPEPSSPQFAEAAADRIEALVRASRGRAFLLFTSHRQMQQLARLLAGRIEQPVLIQGEQPKPQLLDEFRRRPSVLFATQSFWEGVDVVGEALELVVIDKLPFAPPDDPLVAARCRRITEDGGDAFSGYSVPEAALALAQGFGRLIRHRSDRGVVALLDRRAVTRGYGRRVLGSLPPECPRTSDLAAVQQFFALLRARREPAIKTAAG